MAERTPVAVIGAAGFGGALYARLAHAHPSLELTAVTARSDAGRRHDALYPRHGVPLTMEELDPDRIVLMGRDSTVSPDCTVEPGARLEPGTTV